MIARAPRIPQSHDKKRREIKSNISEYFEEISALQCEALDNFSEEDIIKFDSPFASILTILEFSQQLSQADPSKKGTLKEQLSCFLECVAEAKIEDLFEENLLFQKLKTVKKNGKRPLIKDHQFSELLVVLQKALVDKIEEIKNLIQKLKENIETEINFQTYLKHFKKRVREASRCHISGLITVNQLDFK